MINKNFVVSKCQSADADKIYKLDKLCFNDAYLPEMVRRMLDDNLMLKVEFDGQIIAYIALQIIPPEGEIIKIAVKNEFRKQGIGSFILNSAIKKCLKNGVSRLFLEVNEVNRQAISFYTKAGFSIISTRQKYYGDKSALIMQKEIN